ncbi:hypothetical protein ES702_04345 [subsurface metagenome]
MQIACQEIQKMTCVSREVIYISEGLSFVSKRKGLVSNTLRVWKAHWRWL